MLTKISIVSLPGLGNLLLAIYISKRLLPEAREDEHLTKKLKLLAAFNLILVVMAGTLFGVIFLR
ncbi:MAG TPA: hypothetical protein VM901_11110 [Bdellovibrionota bacterium]|nr:hypothetical protein [Bdellovibrionota bacterium]